MQNIDKAGFPVCSSIGVLSNNIILLFRSCLERDNSLFSFEIIQNYKKQITVHKDVQIERDVSDVSLPTKS